VSTKQALVANRPEVRKKISEAVKGVWARMSEEEREERKRKIWEGWRKRNLGGRNGGVS